MNRAGQPSWLRVQERGVSPTAKMGFQSGCALEVVEEWCRGISTTLLFKNLLGGVQADVHDLLKCLQDTGLVGQASFIQRGAHVHFQAGEEGRKEYYIQRPARGRLNFTMLWQWNSHRNGGLLASYLAGVPPGWLPGFPRGVGAGI